MAELVSTELSYVGKIDVLIDVFKRPLQQNSALVSQADVRAIFGDIDSIRATNGELLSRLKKWRSDPAAISDAVESFAQVSSYLASYQSYINGYETAAATLARLRGENSAFAKFLSQAQADPRCEGLAIDSLLIMPVQRIPRYLLLLRELRKHTAPSAAADIAKLDAAITAIGRVAVKVNDSKGDAQARAMVWALQSQLVGLSQPLISVPSRRFVREGVFSHVPDAETKPELWSVHRRQLLCFDDVVVVAKAKPDSQGRRQVLHELPLHDLRTSLTESHGSGVLVLTSASKHVILAFASCANDDDAKSWAELLRSCSAELRSKRASFAHSSHH